MPLLRAAASIIAASLTLLPAATAFLTVPCSLIRGHRLSLLPASSDISCRTLLDEPIRCRCPRMGNLRRCGFKAPTMLTGAGTTQDEDWAAKLVMARISQPQLDGDMLCLCRDGLFVFAL